MAGPDQAAKQSTEVLHQTRQGPKGKFPAKMAIGAVAIAAAYGYFLLHDKKNAKASRGTAGVSKPEKTRPR